ncbi:MAG TPA: isocyanide synthase family protein [Bacteriovoracaceae bacterium]|nr:isocyanide synthase family protein [Bacteriovoracaceae bacterium]
MENRAISVIAVKNHQLKESLVIDSAQVMARRILAEIMNFRRTIKTSQSCSPLYCPDCFSPHLPKIKSAVRRNKPVVFVLPAFPGKSPNKEKVLGVLPDQAERLALKFLQDLCLRIEKFYLPGIKIILCSDGRVFSDVVGMREDDVSAYQSTLDSYIDELSLSSVSTFNLDDLYGGQGFVQMRDELMRRYGKSLESLREKVRRGASPGASPEEKEANRMYCGVTRFLFEDSSYVGQSRSRASVQKESRANAYEVMRRSNAWSELIKERFPDAVRLSIHPQACGSQKLGIRLVGNESWMTPWHGVAVETSVGYVLLKRSEAEALGAQVVHSPGGRPSHYTLMGKQNLSIEAV